MFTQPVPALEHNVENYFCTECGEFFGYETENDTRYPFTYNSSGELVSTNKANSSSSSYKIVALTDITVSFKYNVSSESNYDYLYIYHNTTQKVQKSGTSNSYVSYTINLAAGDFLRFTYSKDSSQSSGNDCCYIKDLVITPFNGGYDAGG